MEDAADYIVVGAGTAGCTAAEALSRDGRLRVLLVEAGGRPRSPFVDVPAGFPRLLRGALDWGYVAEPEGEAGRVVAVPRGRMLGGSANLNAQIHQWGHPADYDAWVRSGAPGWSWAEVAPRLRRLEGIASAGPGRGSDGPLRAEPLRSVHPLTETFLATARLAGQPASYNGGDYQGAWLAEVNHRGGRRHSVWHALLAPAMKRPNLRVLDHALADAVVFEGVRARGLRVVRGGRALELAASRGVLVCAGAFGSPRLLLRSGIGPAGSLRELGLPVVLDQAGVGANLHDHPMACPTFGTARRDTLAAAERPTNLLRFLLRRRGPLASNVAESIAFFRTRAELEGPDVEVLFAPVEWREQGLAPPTGHAFTLGTILLTPRSRGRVGLRDAGLESPPTIELGLLSDPEGEDRRVMIAAIRLAREIAGRAPLVRESTGEWAPGESVRSDDEIGAWLDRDVQTVYHPGGTCRMGTDPDAVVGPDLAVRGLGGLWVADASVMPGPIRGHPNLAVAMIGARAAETLAAR